MTTKFSISSEGSDNLIESIFSIRTPSLNVISSTSYSEIKELVSISKDIVPENNFYQFLAHLIPLI